MNQGNDFALVRQAGLEDAAVIADFQLAMAWETEQKRLDREWVHQAVRAVFEDRNKGFYLVAQAGDQVISSLLVTCEWSDWRNTNIWYMQSVYVRPEWRRRGCFRLMYRHLLQLAAEQSVRVVRLYVETDNRAAQSVYESLGMKRLPYYMYQADL